MKQCLARAKAIADENRIRILLFLRGGELCVCQIVEMLQLAPSTVSKHLSILNQAGLIDSRKQSRWMYYRLPDQDPSPAIIEAIEWVYKSVDNDPQILADAKRLKAVRKMDARALCCHYHKEK